MRRTEIIGECGKVGVRPSARLKMKLSLSAAKMNPKQRIFVREFLKDKNATRAYCAAFGDRKGAAQSASRLLRNAKVSQAVEKGLAKQEVEIGITAEQNLRELANIAYYKPGVKVRDRIRAMELIGKHFGSFSEKVEMTTKSTAKIVLTIPRNGSEVKS